MPRAWEEREKEIVRKTLLEEGKKLFEQYGLQKTTVDEIVRAAKISKGAFYLFYKSKEELYFDILESIEHEIRSGLFEQAFPDGVPRKEAFKDFLEGFIDMVLSSPMLKTLTTTDYEYLLRKIPPEQVARHTQSDLTDFAGWFKGWIDLGYIKPVDLNALSGVLMSMFYFIIHRDDVAGIDFQDTKRLWIDILASYLVEE